MISSFKIPETASTISRPPSSSERNTDRIMRGTAWCGATFIILLTAYLLWKIGAQAWPAIVEHGLGFVIGTTWDSARGTFGVLPEIWGTLYSSLLALLIGGLFGVAIAIFLTQDFINPRLATLFRMIVEMLVAIPSVVYGLWGNGTNLSSNYPIVIPAQAGIHVWSGCRFPPMRE